MIPMDINLIAYEFDKGQFTPNKVYPSGEKEEDNIIDKYRPSLNLEEYPVLILEDDIINSDGFGLKKGYYNVVSDKFMDFLYIYQSGKLKAKIPVVQMHVFETLNPEQPKIKKMSMRAYKKQQEKEYRKYLKGLNPKEIEYRDVQIHYIADKNAYIIIYNNDNVELTGMIKLD